jgi:hypothetical protein
MLYALVLAEHWQFEVIFIFLKETRKYLVSSLYDCLFLKIEKYFVVELCCFLRLGKHKFI